MKISLFFLFFSSISLAQFASRLEVYGSADHKQILNDSLINSQNSVLKLPDQSQTLEIRPDLQWQLSEPFNFVIRSRHLLQRTQIPLESEADQTTLLGISDLTDLFLSLQATDQTSFVVGLQNYQWGPAEILSPSNIFYHFKNDQRSYYYKEKGRVLLRANHSLNEKTQVTIISEPTDNRTQNWVAEVDFKPQSAFKIERQLETPVDLAALVIGNSGPKGQYIAGHFNYSVQETYSFYADAKIEQDGSYYFISPTSNNLILSTTDSDRPAKALSVVGIRYEGEFDFRQELILNEAGFSRSDWNKAKLAITTLSPSLVANLNRFNRSGLELLSNAYSYTSLRFPDFGQSNQIHTSTRWLKSLVQDSSVLQLNLEYDFSDAVVISSELLLPIGQKDTEFKLLQGHQFTLGFKATY